MKKNIRHHLFCSIDRSNNEFNPYAINRIYILWLLWGLSSTAMVCICSTVGNIADRKGNDKKYPSRTLPWRCRNRESLVNPLVEDSHAHLTECPEHWKAQDKYKQNYLIPIQIQKREITYEMARRMKPMKAYLISRLNWHNSTSNKKQKWTERSILFKMCFDN